MPLVVPDAKGQRPLEAGGRSGLGTEIRWLCLDCHGRRSGSAASHCYDDSPVAAPGDRHEVRDIRSGESRP